MSESRRAMMLGLVSALAVTVVVACALLHVLPAHGPGPARTAAVTRQKRAARPHTAGSHTAGPGTTGPGTAGPRTTPATGSAWTSVAADGGGPGARIADLSGFTPVQEFNVSKIVTGPVRIGTTTYTDSVRFTCDSGGHDSAGDLDYVVTGYGSLSAVLGVPSDDAGAAGDTMTVSFFNNGTGMQTSAPVTVSPGHPQPVHLRFSGSSQLEISCSAVRSATRSARYMELALGNATIGPS
jgi:hypothetical protein